MSEVRCYSETWRGYFAARIEVWPAKGPPNVTVFTFDSLLKLIAFEKWIDATVHMITEGV